MMHKILPHPHVAPQQHHHIHHMAPPPQHIGASAGPPMNMGMAQQQAPPLPSAQQTQHHNQPYHQVNNRALQQQHHNYHHQHQHQRMNNSNQPPHIHPNRGNYHPATVQPSLNSNTSVRGHTNAISSINTNAMVSSQQSQLLSPQQPQTQHLGPQQQQQQQQSHQHQISHAKPNKTLHQPKSGKQMQILKPHRPHSSSVAESKNILQNGNVEKVISNRTNVMPSGHGTNGVVGSSTSDNTNITTDPSETQIGKNNIIIGRDETADGQILKVKTPMCLVNELARHNHFQHQYRLIKETGPAHSKSFTVTLKLGEENYTAEGKSIKKAQHSAAAEAIKATKYPHPPEKTQRQHTMQGKHNNGTLRPNNSLTPMVELNALLMKKGQHPTYTVQYPVPVPDHTRKYGRFNNNNNNTRHVKGGNGFRTNSSFPFQTTPDNPYKVTFIVLGKEYAGEGITLQLAKHEAAANAIEDLKATMPAPTAESRTNTSNIENPQQDPTTLDLTKSAISLVYEIALKRNLHISFNVENETGPAHMKHFITKCTVGDISTVGEGNGKKSSKKAAAEKMLEELQKLPPLPAVTTPTLRPPSNRPVGRVKKRSVTVTPVVKKKPRNLIKDVVRTSDNGVVVEDEVTNPISRLLRIQQARKQKDPVYTVIEERGQQRRKEFVIEVNVNGEKAEGVGPNKKVAKRAAAENVMIKLGFSKQNEGTQGEKVYTVTSTTEKGKKVGYKYPEKLNNVGGSSGRQLAPGLILMRNVENKAFNPPPESGINQTTTATIAKELLAEGSSPTAEAIVKQANAPQKAVADGRSPERTVQNEPMTQVTPEKPPKIVPISSPGGIRAIDQLRYLADLLKFEVQFSDFPKGNHNDCLTLLSLNTDPPQIFHGSGSNSECSQNQAAMSALKALSELGLDNVSKKLT